MLVCLQARSKASSGTTTKKVEEQPKMEVNVEAKAQATATASSDSEAKAKAEAEAKAKAEAEAKANAKAEAEVGGRSSRIHGMELWLDGHANGCMFGPSKLVVVAHSVMGSSPKSSDLADRPIRPSVAITLAASDALHAMC